MNTRSIGNTGEAAAANYLQSLGWKIIGQHLHYRFGEIDILAEAKDHLVIVEVKAKKSSSHGLAVEMLTKSKQAVLRKLAKLMVYEYNKPVRIDVITIDDFNSTCPKLVHYPFAIGE